MRRDYLVEHLENEGCHPDTDFGLEVGELWNNCINGEMCNVPHDDDLELTTWCHIIYELKVAPPIEHDSDYYVYVAWRENQLQSAAKDKI